MIRRPASVYRFKSSATNNWTVVFKTLTTRLVVSAMVSQTSRKERTSSTGLITPTPDVGYCSVLFPGAKKAVNRWNHFTFWGPLLTNTEIAQMLLFNIWKGESLCTRTVALSTNRNTWSTKNIPRWWHLYSEAYFWVHWYVSRKREHYRCSRALGRVPWPACDLARVFPLCIVNHDAFFGDLMGRVYGVPLN